MLGIIGCAAVGMARFGRLAFRYAVGSNVEPRKAERMGSDVWVDFGVGNVVMAGIVERVEVEL